MNNKEKYFWIKLHLDFFKSDVIEYIMERNHGLQFTLLYIMLCLITANTNGVLRKDIGDLLIPINNDDIIKKTKILNLDELDLEIALDLFLKINLIEKINFNNQNFYKLNYLGLDIGFDSNKNDARRKRHQRKNKKEKNRKKEIENLFLEEEE